MTGYRCVLNGGDHDTHELILPGLLDHIVMPDIDTGAAFRDEDGNPRPHQHYALAYDDQDQPLTDIRGRYLYRWQYRIDEPNQAGGVAGHRTSPEQAPRPPTPRPDNTDRIRP